MALSLRRAIRAFCCTSPAILAACGGSPPAARDAQAAGAPSAMVADTATITVPRSYPAQVYVERDVIVAALSAGNIDTLHVVLGSSVRAGQVLATIESRDQEIEHSRASVEVERQQRSVARARELAKRGFMTSADSEQVEFDLKRAEQALRKAERDVELTRITAPFAGVVTARYVSPRGLVQAGDTLFRVAETAPQLVRVRVPEPGARGVRIGDRAMVVGGETRRVGAVVTFAAPALDPASGTREVILRLADARFLPGESVRVEMGSERRMAIVAPREAIAAEGYALVVDRDRTTMRPVVVGATLDGARVEILSGLAAGERLAKVER